MNDEFNINPYHNQQDSMANIVVTPLMIEYLRATKPWVRFLSIVLFISVGFMFLGGLLVILSSSMSRMGGAGIGPMIGILYLIFGALYLAPAYFLHQYASSINDLLRGGGDVAMETALASQKSFWRFIGILTLILLCVYGAIILFAILGAFSMLRPNSF